MSNIKTHVLKTRLQVLLTREEGDRFRHQAEIEGMSLSGWLREAGLERLQRRTENTRIETLEQLDVFFAECDEQEAGKGPEPDWEEHAAVIRRSQSSGASDT